MFEHAIKILAERLNENSQEKLRNVKSLIDALNLHIEKGNLSLDEIKKYVEELTLFCFLAPIDVSLSESRRVVRAVKFEGSDDIGHKNLSRLSYIPKNTKVIPQLGRLNRQGNSMYYACWGYHPNSVGGVLSEVKACPGDVFNLLISKTVVAPETKNKFDELLLMVPIGLSDYLRRGISHPFAKIDLGWNKVYAALVNATCPEGMLSLQLADAFMLDVLSRKNHDRLYDVTSALSAEILSTPHVDGAIYPSTQFEGFPSVALKPATIDKKFKHEKVVSIRVLEEYGYGIYKTEKLGDGTINEGDIEWRRTQEIINKKPSHLFQVQWEQ